MVEVVQSAGEGLPGPFVVFVPILVLFGGEAPEVNKPEALLPFGEQWPLGSHAKPVTQPASLEQVAP